MGTTYTPPSISSAGLQLPTYAAILSWLIGQYQAIYGANVYLGVDSADYQDLATRALIAFDTGQSLQGVYQSFNPQTGIGASLDMLGRLIGVARRSSSYSTASVILSGTPGTTVTNGVARDQNGELWNIASPATIGTSGTVTVIATSQVIGNINAEAGEISIIATPTAGWTGITNPAAALPGVAVEADSTYRARLLISQAKPSLTRLAGTVGAVAAVSGVTRSVVYENYGVHTASYGLVNTSGTSFTILVGYPLDASVVGDQISINGTNYTIATVNSGGLSGTTSVSAGTQTSVPFQVNSPSNILLGPAHSISTVVEGGVGSAIAQAIYDNRGIGCLTNGTTLIPVADPLNPAITMPISFSILSYVQVYVSISVHGLIGFTTSTESQIALALVNYLNSLGIGQSVVYSELYGAALTARPNPDEPLFSIRSVQSGALSAETAAATTSGNPVVTVASATGIATGQAVTGSGIPAGTTVSSISGASITLSANATATASAAALSFFTLGTSDIPINFNAAAQGSATNVLVTTV